MEVVAREKHWQVAHQVFYQTQPQKIMLKKSPNFHLFLPGLTCNRIRAHVYIVLAGIYLTLTEYPDHGILLAETVIQLDTALTDWVSWLVSNFHTDGLQFNLRFPSVVAVACCSATS